jgi:carboxymethylenebutenolidase
MYRLLFLTTLIAAASAQDWALARLQKSPRHQEWVQVKSGDHTLQAFVVYPERSGKTPVVLVIHENMGLTDWVRSLADQLAEAGYIAIAPDLISGSGPKTSELTTDAARNAIYKLAPDGVTADLNAVADFALKFPAANGKLAVAGFCWGGGNSFRFATNRPDLKAAFVFYGTGPETPESIARIKAPVYGFYGGNDARVNATISKSEELTKEAHKTYQPVIYEGAGHGFMRAGEDPAGTEANRKARADAWLRWKALLEKL